MPINTEFFFLLSISLSKNKTTVLSGFTHSLYKSTHNDIPESDATATILFNLFHEVSLLIRTFNILEQHSLVIAKLITRLN